MPYPNYTNPYNNPYGGQPYPMAASQPQYQPPVVPRTPAQPQNQYATPQAFSSLSGRMINDISEVTPQEVPMNGTVSFFPTNDYSTIFAKCWSPDGTIQTFKFVPEQQVPQEPQEDPFEKLNKRLDKIEELVSNRKPYYNKNKRPYNNEEHKGEDNGD